jgi:hypothetical protein
MIQVEQALNRMVQGKLDHYTTALNFAEDDNILDEH